METIPSHKKNDNQSTPRKYYIYILKDPRDQSVRYVGCSTNPQQRYRQHLIPDYSPPREKREWILELRSLCLKPELEIIDSVENKDEASNKETYWIHHYTEMGAELLNGVCIMRRKSIQYVEEVKSLDCGILKQLQSRMGLSKYEIINLAMQKLALEIGITSSDDSEGVQG